MDRHEPSAERSFMLQTNQGTFHSSSVVIATGGLSIAPLGATDFGYRIARQFGLRIEETRAGLVPLTLPAQILKALAALSGVSIDALVTCPESPSFRENILITHRGLSGPAILQVSNYWRPGESISINLLPDEDVMEIISAARIIEGDLAPGSAPSCSTRARRRPEDTAPGLSWSISYHVTCRDGLRRPGAIFTERRGRSNSTTARSFRKLRITFTGSSLRRPERKASEKLK